MVFLNVFEPILESEPLVQVPSAFFLHSSHLILSARACSTVVICARPVPEWTIKNAAATNISGMPWLLNSGEHRVYDSARQTELVLFYDANL